MRLRNFLGFVLGSLFNFSITLITIILVYNFTLMFYNMSKDYMIRDDLESAKEVTVTVPENASLKQVSKLLEEKGLVKNAIIFQIENVIEGSNHKFQGGTYSLNTSMDTTKIINTIKKQIAPPTDIKVTIKEGLNQKEIAELLESKGIVKAEEFLNACNTEKFEYDFLEPIKDREKKLEGYLFPDTYFFIKSMSPKQVINKMLVRFDEIYSYEYTVRADELGLKTDDVIKLASIIEKEVTLSKEKINLSTLLQNRIKQNMKLEMPSTVLYVLEKRRDQLTKEDLKTKSPYNTYINQGLPIGPISNPSAASIEAVLYPEESDYLYFVLKDEKTGEHVFLNTNDEYIKAKAEYNQKY